MGRMPSCAMLTDRLVIRRATAADAPALSAFGRRVFAATFEAENNPADLAAYLDGAYTVAHQQADIADPSIDTLLLEIDGALAAFAQVRVSEVPACVGARAALELARFYVDHGWHGRGVAARLLTAVESAAAEHAWHGRVVAGRVGTQPARTGLLRQAGLHGRRLAHVPAGLGSAAGLGHGEDGARPWGLSLKSWVDCGDSHGVCVHNDVGKETQMPRHWFCPTLASVDRARVDRPRGVCDRSRSSRWSRRQRRSPPRRQGRPSNSRSQAGPFPVGTSSFNLIDDDRVETFSDNAEKRQVHVLAWYPAVDNASGSHAPYLRAGMQEARAFATLMRQPEIAFDYLAGVKTWALVDAPPRTGAPLPVLLFSHGYTAQPSSYTALWKTLPATATWC